MNLQLRSGILVGLLVLCAGAAFGDIGLDFNISAHSPSMGSITYAGLAMPLVGTGIVVDNVIGLGTPAKDGDTVNCVGCTLSFTTGNLTGSSPDDWEFGGGGSITLFGTMPSIGINTLTKLLEGIFDSAEVDKLKPPKNRPDDFRVALGGFSYYVKAPDLATHYGYQADQALDGNFNISFKAAGNAPNSFTSTQVLSGDLDGSPVPDGGVTLMLLGGALVGLETMRRKLRV